VQLDLFEDSPRDYLEAQARLAELDFAGCRAALERYARRFPRGLETRPWTEAAAWVEDRLPPTSADAPSAGRRLLSVARALREGTAPGALSGGCELRDTLVRSLARLALERVRAGEVTSAFPVDSGLPWGVFHLLAGRPREAVEDLRKAAFAPMPTPEASLALGDACWSLGREGGAYLAYREGFALDPEGAGWAIGCEPLREARERLKSSWGTQWWAVGGYLDGVFPCFGRIQTQALRQRWVRFQRLHAEWRGGAPQEPRLFLEGLALSENGSTLLGRPEFDLEHVRRTLAELHPEAWELHWEALRERRAP